jgi:RimJ/RimL family protein N-acetyltransferase
MRLRKLEQSDLATIHRWRNDPQVTRHLARREMSLAEIESWFEKLEGGRDEAYAIIAGGTFVGYAVLEKIDAVNRKCEAGIIIGERPYWRKGIGKEVARWLVEKAFNELGMHRVLAVTSARNPAAIACFKAAGFKEEGRLREANLREGEYVDLILLSLLEHELPSCRPKGSIARSG